MTNQFLTDAREVLVAARDNREQGFAVDICARWEKSARRLNKGQRCGWNVLDASA